MSRGLGRVSRRIATTGKLWSIGFGTYCTLKLVNVCVSEMFLRVMLRLNARWVHVSGDTGG